jgi:DnaJ-class molecular chaperone
MALSLHPDKCSSELRISATAKFQALRSVVDVLMDVERKAAYDDDEESDASDESEASDEWEVDEAENEKIQGRGQTDIKIHFEK